MPMEGFDIMENNDGNVVVLADGMEGGVDFIRQLAAENEINIPLGIMLFESVEHECHSRTEGV